MRCTGGPPLFHACAAQDFNNLVDVYLDAVFFPRCISDRRVFEQEGWHLELDEKEGDMTFKVRARGGRGWDA